MHVLTKIICWDIILLNKMFTLMFSWQIYSQTCSHTFFSAADCILLPLKRSRSRRILKNFTEPCEILRERWRRPWTRMVTDVYDFYEVCACDAQRVWSLGFYVYFFVIFEVKRTIKIMSVELTHEKTDDSVCADKSQSQIDHVPMSKNQLKKLKKREKWLQFKAQKRYCCWSHINFSFRA